MKTLNEFQAFACEKWFGNKETESAQYLSVPALGVAGEAGEVADKIKKVLRGDKDIELSSIAVEISDVLFYCAVLADRIGYDLSEVAQMQVDKINDRRARGVERGEGDNR